MKPGFSTASVAAILAAMPRVSGCRSPSVDERQHTALATPSHAWAVLIEKPGLPNFHHVSDDLNRGAQPTAEGFRQLKAMGIKTVVNLRSSDNDRERIAGTGLAYEEIPMHPWQAKEQNAVRFLKLVAVRSRGPFFVHCYYGADRTGMLCAAYRIVIQGWTKDEAVAEMTQGGFGVRGTWQNLVNYFGNLDVEKLKRRVFHSRVQELFIFVARAKEFVRRGTK